MHIYIFIIFTSKLSEYKNAVVIVSIIQIPQQAYQLRKSFTVASDKVCRRTLSDVCFHWEGLNQ